MPKTPKFALILLAPLCAIVLCRVTLADPDITPFPTPPSKKGLQVQMVDDALALGIKHAALNVNLSQLLDIRSNINNPTLHIDNHDFSFHRGYVEHLDRQIKALSDHQVVVSLILLYYRSADEALNKLMLHPKYDPAAPNNLSAFNTTNPESTAALDA